MLAFIRLYCRVFEFLIASMLALMVLLVFGNVVLRYGFNSGIAVSEELSRWLFIWITFLGAVVALHERAHLGVDMVVGRLPAVAKKLCLAASYITMLYILVLLCQGSVAQMRINWDTAAPVTGASMAIVDASGLVFALCAGLILATDFVRLLAGRLSEEELIGVQESEEAAVLAEVLGPHATPAGAAGTANATPRSS